MADDQEVPQRQDAPHPHAFGDNGQGGPAGEHEGHDSSVPWIGGARGDQTAGNSAARQMTAEMRNSSVEGAAPPGSGNQLAPVSQ